jgi:DNA-binding IclR family transcriptional regulator
MAMPPKGQGAAAASDKPVKSADRVFDLIEAIGRTRDGITFPDLQTALGIPKSSLFALLESAAARGYLELDDSSRRWRLGMRVWEAGQAYARQHELLHHAEAVMRDVVGTINETIQLARLDGNENVYIAKVDSTHPLRLQSDVGGRLMAHATGLGKTLLAELPDAEVKALFADSGLPRMTENTLTSFKALLGELAATRARGFGIDNAEYTHGIFCLSAPIRTVAGPAQLALSITVPILRVSVDGLAAALAALAKACVEIGTRAGGPAPDPKLARLVNPAAARAAIEDLHNCKRYKLPFALG